MQSIQYQDWASGQFMMKGQEVSYPQDGHSACYQIEEKSFWFRQRNRIIATVLKKCRLPGVFADVGGGNGFVSYKLKPLFPELKFILVEPGLEGCQNASARGLTEIYNKSLSELTEYSHLENIGVFDVIEHIQDDLNFIKEIHKKLAPGGKVLITVPAYQWLWSNEDLDAGHFRRYTVSQLKSLATASGFQVEFSSYFFVTLIPLIYLFRTLPEKLNIKRKTNKGTSDHENSLLSKILETALDFEHALIRLGVRFPFGASIVMCFKK